MSWKTSAYGASAPGRASNYALLSVVLAVALTSLPKIWQNKVNTTVPDPYLDEFFHVRQAQLYCARNFSYWDPKITTPPGLYVASYFMHRFGQSCDLYTLRKTNTGFLMIGVLLPSLLLFVARDHAKGKPGTRWINFSVDRDIARALHSALNICLFPPLFFFTALYYTDVASTACVLGFLELRQNDFLAPRYFLRACSLILLGLLAICFRQTNIFWVAIFPAALDLVRALKTRSPDYPSVSPLSNSDVHLSIAQVMRDSWQKGVIYDPPFDAAYFEDFIKFTLSVVISTLRAPISAFDTLAPYILLTVAFCTFVLYNGGVVLGDKANHVATIHVPQMLYIWPYIFFFSWQLIIPRARALISPLESLPHVFRRFRPLNPSRAFPRIATILAFLTFALVSVHYNTIVHPFTLADNRHYVFYVFRILLRHPAIKYLATPVYIFCAWAALLALGLPPDNSSTSAVSKSTKSKQERREPQQDTMLFTPTRGCYTSYVLVWFLSTTLCLISAPLVEPRYVIVPWITWRLGVANAMPDPLRSPAKDATNSTQPQRPSNALATRLKNTLQFLNHGEHRLYVETFWFVLVNSVTGYMFLYKGFEWPHEPEVVQRFMW